MTQPTTPAEVVRELWEIEQHIDAETKALVSLRDEYAGLLREHRLDFANTFLSAEGSMDFRRRLAEQRTIGSWTKVQVHEQRMEACRDKLRALRERAEIYRSINSNVKEELRFTASTGGWTA